MLKISQDIPQTLPDGTEDNGEYGAFKNDSSPNAGDGTPYLANWANDLWYQIYRVLINAGITPNGQNAKDGDDQFLQALRFISQDVNTTAFAKSNSIYNNIALTASIPTLLPLQNNATEYIDTNYVVYGAGNTLVDVVSAGKYNIQAHVSYRNYGTSTPTQLETVVKVGADTIGEHIFSPTLAGVHTATIASSVDLSALDVLSLEIISDTNTTIAQLQFTLLLTKVG